MKRIIDYTKLPISLKTAIRENYPEGFEDQLTDVKSISGESFKGLFFTYEESQYLIKFSLSKSFSANTDNDDDFNDLDIDLNLDENE